MHDLDIIKINECLVAKSLLTNVTKTNEHSNIAKFVYALLHAIPCFLFLPEKYQNHNLQPLNLLIPYMAEHSRGNLLRSQEKTPLLEVVQSSCKCHHLI